MDLSKIMTPSMIVLRFERGRKDAKLFGLRYLWKRGDGEATYDAVEFETGKDCQVTLKTEGPAVVVGDEDIAGEYSEAVYPWEERLMVQDFASGWGARQRAVEKANQGLRDYIRNARNFCSAMNLTPSPFMEKEYKEKCLGKGRV